MSLLLTSEQLAARDGVPEWVCAAHERYREVILDPDFPCYFGTKAEAQGHMRFAWAAHDRDGSLPRALAEFVAFSRANPKRRHVFIAFFPDGPAGLDAQTRRFWDILGWLHTQDPQPWPGDVPADTEDPGWEFCFAGDPMFAFPCLPAYERRLSRRVGDQFALCFQPRRVFFGVNRDDPGGERIRADIYDRVRRWDRVEPHPELVDLAYGDPTMREWRQYALPDDNGPLLAACPFSTSRRRP